MERKWLARPYQDGDEKGIFELWQTVYPNRKYHREQWLKWWHWMYRDNPAGPGWIWLAEHNRKIVGQYPLIFMSIKVGNEIVRGSQNIDLMTHPDYQHQGIFSTLERTALEKAGKEGVPITIGFPNEEAYPGHIKSGWFDIRSMQVMLKPLNWGNALKLRVSNKFLLKLGVIGGGIAERTIYRTRKAPDMGDLTVAQVPSFDERIDEFWTKVSHQHQIMVVRNKAYLNWRYSTPGVNYKIFIAEKAREIFGYLVLRQREHGDVKLGFIYDMIAESSDVMHCLVSKVLEYGQKNKIDMILYDLLADKTYYRVIKQNGFISLFFLKGQHFCAYSSSPSIPREILGNPKNWFVQMGDSDAI